jgi:hypothetical protein
MTQIKDLDFNKIKFTVIKKDALKCYINYNDKDKLDVEFPISSVTFNVDFSYNRPNLSINLIDHELIEFNSKLQNLIVENVFKNSKKIYGTQRTREALQELYCNPQKFAPAGKKYYDLLQLKINKNMVKTDSLSKGDKVKLTVQVSGLWFSETSFGPYLNVISIEKDIKKKIEFVDSDSDTEINID